MADSREYLAGRRDSMAAGEAFAAAILRELERVGTEADWAVFAVYSRQRGSWVWMRCRTERERLDYLWRKHTLRLPQTQGMVDGSADHAEAGDPDAV